MVNNNFVKEKKLGARAERYVAANARKVIGKEDEGLFSNIHYGSYAQRHSLPAVGRIEGRDLAVGTFSYDPMDKVEFVLPDGNLRSGYRAKPHLYGIEVKGVEKKAAFLMRDDNGGELSGTLPFELWNEKKTNNGWLHSFVDPDNHVREIESEASDTPPAYLVFALILDNEGKRIMATISFKWEELAPRLNKLSGGRLIPWKMDPAKGKKEELEASGMKILGYGNVWHVPLSEIVDLARIVMVEEPTEEELQRYEWMKSGKLKPGVIRQRLAYLKEHAVECG